VAIYGGSSSSSSRSAVGGSKGSSIRTGGESNDTRQNLLFAICIVALVEMVISITVIQE